MSKGMPVRRPVTSAPAGMFPTTITNPPSLPSPLLPVLPLDSSAACSHGEPPFDGESNDELDVVGIAIEGEWTGVTFARWGVGDDDSVSIHRGLAV